MLTKVLMPALSAALLVLGAQTLRLSWAQDALAVAELTLAGCDARTSNILEDKESDNEIDLTHDSDIDDLLDPKWLFRPGGTGGQ